jgi:hypothetical protein
VIKIGKVMNISDQCRSVAETLLPLGCQFFFPYPLHPQIFFYYYYFFYLCFLSRVLVMVIKYDYASKFSASK